MTWMQVDKPACPVYLQMTKDFVLKHSYNRAIMEQGIKPSWSAAVCVAVTTLSNKGQKV